MKDYADWLTPERLDVEEKMWGRVKSYEHYAAALERVMTVFPGVEHIVELGCGTGWVPTALTPVTKYTCIDRYPGCVELARQKNASRPWVEVVDAEIRSVSPVADIVCAFGVLKHFTLDEWQPLFSQLFSGARFGVFTVPISETSHHDNYEFTHTWLCEKDLAQAVALAGHRELWRVSSDRVGGDVEPIFTTQKCR